MSEAKPTIRVEVMGFAALYPSYALYEQQVEETRRMNVTLERIAAAMEKRGRS